MKFLIMTLVLGVSAFSQDYTREDLLEIFLPDDGAYKSVGMSSY